MEVFNINVYEIAQSAVASGFPMLSSYPTEEEFEIASDLAYKEGPENHHFKRLFKLAKAPDGSGHKNALKGILVAFNVTGSIKWWTQAERYSHFEIVSSMSTMHKLKDLVESGHVGFAPETAVEVINAFEFYYNEHNDLPVSELAYSVPVGLELCARVTTNYLQLRTIWVQRHNHPLEEWKLFCQFIEGLPYAQQLILNKGAEDE